MHFMKMKNLWIVEKRLRNMFLSLFSFWREKYGDSGGGVGKLSHCTPLDIGKR